LVEKGGTMKYETPRIDDVGPARELIQAYIGPRYDGDGSIFSQGAVCSPLEEE
jgi:hypothetical protein